MIQSYLSQLVQQVDKCVQLKVNFELDVGTLRLNYVRDTSAQSINTTETLLIKKLIDNDPTPVN